MSAGRFETFLVRDGEIIVTTAHYTVEEPIAG
jgi:hypothetical protein